MAVQPPFEIETGLSFIGASNVSGNQDGTGVTIVTTLQDEPGLGTPELLVNRGVSGMAMTDQNFLDRTSAAGLAGNRCVFQVAGINDSDTSVSGRLAAMDDIIQAFGSTEFTVHSGVPVQTTWRNDKWPKNQFFFEALAEVYPGQVNSLRLYSDFEEIFPNVDGSGNVIPDDGAASLRRRDGVIPESLRYDSAHVNQHGYKAQGENIYRASMLALGSSYRFPYVPHQRVYTTDPSSRALNGEIEVPWYSPYGAAAFDDCTVEVLAKNGMGAHFEAVVSSGALKLKRRTAGYPNGQSICEVWVRITKWDKHYDALLRVLLGEPGAFGMVKYDEAMQLGYMPSEGEDGRKGTFVMQFVPNDASTRTPFTNLTSSDVSSGGFFINRATSSRLYTGVYRDGSNLFDGSIQFHSVADDPDDPSGVWTIFASIDLDGGGENAAVLDAALVRPNGTITREQKTATVTGTDRVQVSKMLRFLHQVGGSPHPSKCQRGIMWVSREWVDLTDNLAIEQFIDPSTGEIATGVGQLGAPGNDTGSVTIAGSAHMPITYYGYGNAADALANTNWGSAVGIEAGRTFLGVRSGRLLDVDLEHSVEPEPAALVQPADGEFALAGTSPSLTFTPADGPEPEPDPDPPGPGDDQAPAPGGRHVDMR